LTKKLILASSSPRRQELLHRVGVPFTIRKPYIDESQITTTNPFDKVKQLAMLKGHHVAIESENEVILSADTIISYKDTIFEKPKDREEAVKMISALSGARHEVYTGVLLRSAQKEKVFVEKTMVEFWNLSDEEIAWYVSTDEPYDKAGAYGIQNLGATLVKQIIGDYFNVVGLPIARTVRELREFGI